MSGLHTVLYFGIIIMRVTALSCGSNSNFNDCEIIAVVSEFI